MNRQRETEASIGRLPAFLLAASVPLNSCSVPRRQGRIIVRRVGRTGHRGLKSMTEELRGLELPTSGSASLLKLKHCGTQFAYDLCVARRHTELPPQRRWVDADRQTDRQTEKRTGGQGIHTSESPSRATKMWRLLRTSVAGGSHWLSHPIAEAKKQTVQIAGLSSWRWDSLHGEAVHFHKKQSGTEADR